MKNYDGMAQQNVLENLFNSYVEAGMALSFATKTRMLIECSLEAEINRTLPDNWRAGSIFNNGNKARIFINRISFTPSLEGDTIIEYYTADFSELYLLLTKRINVTDEDLFEIVIKESEDKH